MTTIIRPARRCFSVRPLAVASLALLLGPGAAALAAEEVRLERLVPQETVFFAQIEQVDGLIERLKKTPLWALWESREVQDAIEKALKPAEGEEDPLASIGLTREQLVMPQGLFGAAIFLAMDEELGQKIPVSLMVADFGERADEAAEMFDAVAAKVARDGVKIEERTVRGRPVRSFEIPKPPEDELAAADDEMLDPFDPLAGLPDPGELFGQVDALHLCRDGTRWFLATTIVALEDALEGVDGKGIDAPLERSDEFRRAVGQLGDSKHALAVLQTRPIQTMLAPALGGPAAMAMPFVGMLFGDIRTYSFGLGVDTEAAMVEQVIGIAIEGERVGLPALLAASPKAPPPAFVGPDSVGYARLDVRFAGVMPLINGVVRALPPMFQEQIEMQLDPFRPALEKALAGLGPEMHVATAQSEPVTADSRTTAVAIRCPNADDVKPLVESLAPMAGLTAQDFLGNTIYADEFSPVALGFGGGWMLVGATGSIERVLRSVGQADVAKFADEARFARINAVVPAADLFGWGWTDLAASARHAIVMQKAQEAELREIFGDEEYKAFMETNGDMMELTRAITPEQIEKHLGPAVWWLSATSEGIVYRSVILAPESAPQ